MKFKLLPMEASGKLLFRWARTAIRPSHSWGTIWEEVFRGDSLGAPLGFAYLWILATTPLLGLAVKLGLDGIRSAMGPYVAMSLANSIQVVPATVAAFLIRPLVAMLCGGIVAHGVLWSLESEARGHMRRSLRVFGYACAWVMPAIALVTATSVYIQMNPLAALDQRPGTFPLNAPSALVRLLSVSSYALEGATLLFAAWGLKVVHRSRMWKTLLAGLAAWMVAGITLLLLSALLNHGFVKLLMARHRQVRTADQNPKERFKRMWEIVETSRERAAKALHDSGLPAPPRTVDILTAGNWGLAIDLNQASKDGFLPSCQAVYLSTLSALKGQVVHYSACLGEPVPRVVQGGPEPVLPPGAEALQSQARAMQNQAQKEGMSAARSLFLNALVEVQSGIGPFQAATGEREIGHAPMDSHLVRPEAQRETQNPPDSMAVQSAPRSPFQTPPPGSAGSFPGRETPLQSLERKASSRVSTPEVRLLAEQGYPIAMNELGRRLYHGYSETGRDQAEGAKWLEKAYESGFRAQESCFTLWVAYNNGWGVEKDPAASQRWKLRGEEILP